MTLFLIGIVIGMMLSVIVICAVSAKDPAKDVLKTEKIRKAAVEESNKDVSNGLWKALEIIYSEEEE